MAETATHRWICQSEENRTEFNLRRDKSEAEVRLIIEDCTRHMVLLKLTTDRQRSIARHLCNSRATRRLLIYFLIDLSNHLCRHQLITALIIHHSFTTGSQAAFSTNPSHCRYFCYHLDYLHRSWDWNRLTHRFIFSFCSLNLKNFLFWFHVGVNHVG